MFSDSWLNWIQRFLVESVDILSQTILHNESFCIIDLERKETSNKNPRQSQILAIVNRIFLLIHIFSDGAHE